MSPSYRVGNGGYSGGLQPLSSGGSDVSFIAGVLVGLVVSIVGVALFVLLF